MIVANLINTPPGVGPPSGQAPAPRSQQVFNQGARGRGIYTVAAAEEAEEGRETWGGEEAANLPPWKAIPAAGAP